MPILRSILAPLAVGFLCLINTSCTTTEAHGVHGAHDEVTRAEGYRGHQRPEHHRDRIPNRDADRRYQGRGDDRVAYRDTDRNYQGRGDDRLPEGVSQRRLYDDAALEDAYEAGRRDARFGSPEPGDRPDHAVLGRPDLTPNKREELRDAAREAMRKLRR